MGRWWQIDPKVELFYPLTPYNLNLNNPIRYNDPEGDCPVCFTAGGGAIIGAIAGGIVAAYNGEDITTGVVSGAVGGAIVGSGVGLLATGAVGTGIFSTLTVNTLTGAFASSAEETTKQGIEMFKGNRKNFDTDKIGNSAKVGAVVNTVAGPLGKVVSNKIALSSTQSVTQKVGQIMSKEAQKQLKKGLRRQGVQGKIGVNKTASDITSNRIKIIETETHFIKGMVGSAANTSIETTSKVVENKIQDELDKK